MDSLLQDANIIRLKGHWNVNDIDQLIAIISFLIRCNDEVGDELGQALISLDRINKRLEWYRLVTVKGVS